MTGRPLSSVVSRLISHPHSTVGSDGVEERRFSFRLHCGCFAVLALHESQQDCRTLSASLNCDVCLPCSRPLSVGPARAPLRLSGPKMTCMGAQVHEWELDALVPNILNTVCLGPKKINLNLQAIQFVLCGFNAPDASTCMVATKQTGDKTKSDEHQLLHCYVEADKPGTRIGCTERLAIAHQCCDELGARQQPHATFLVQIMLDTSYLVEDGRVDGSRAPDRLGVGSISRGKTTMQVGRIRFKRTRNLLGLGKYLSMYSFIMSSGVGRETSQPRVENLRCVRRGPRARYVGPLDLHSLMKGSVSYYQRCI